MNSFKNILKIDKHNNWVLVAPLVALNVAYLVFFFLPGQKEIAAMRTDILDTQRYLADAALRPAEIERVGKQIENAETHTDAWRELAPSADNVARLFSEINRRAGTAGVAVTRFEPRQVDEMDHLDRITLHLGAEGSFEQMFRLMRQLEQLPESIWIDSMHFRTHHSPSNILNSALSETDTASVRSEITLAIFAAKSKDSD